LGSASGSVLGLGFDLILFLGCALGLDSGVSVKRLNANLCVRKLVI